MLSQYHIGWPPLHHCGTDNPTPRTVRQVGIPDKILLKEGKLTYEEYNAIKLHSIIGANIFAVSDTFKDIVPIIKYHHERFDGKGYPDALKGTQIPYLSRVLAVCDTFDAIVSRRPYKDENTIEFAIEEISKNSKTQFDENIAIKFIEFLNSNINLVNDVINNKII